MLAARQAAQAMRPASFQTYERGTYEAAMARFVEFQTAIEAVERALISEADYP
jgi:hypothetical protein